MIVIFLFSLTAFLNIEHYYLKTCIDNIYDRD